MFSREIKHAKIHKESKIIHGIGIAEHKQTQRYISKTETRAQLE